MRKKTKAPAKENRERWLLTYADLITLLMVFFVLLFAMSTTDAKKFQELAGSLRRAFNVNVLQGNEQVAVSSNGGSGAPSVIEQQDFNQLNQVIQQFANANNVPSTELQAQITKEGISLTISGVLLFYNGTDQIKPDGVTLLQQLGPKISALPNNVRVEGHTDDIPADNPLYPTNWELSSARAVAVLRFLADQDKVAPQRLSAIGYGQYQPIVPNDTRAHREENRRAVIVILYNAPAGTTPVQP